MTCSSSPTQTRRRPLMSTKHSSPSWVNGSEPLVLPAGARNISTSMARLERSGEQGLAAEGGDGRAHQVALDLARVARGELRLARHLGEGEVERAPARPDEIADVGAGGGGGHGGEQTVSVQKI